jgi:N utilization substance protein B
MKHARIDGIDPAARSRSRRRALQAVYAWQLSHTPVNQVLEQFSNEQDMEVADLVYFEALVRGVINGHKELDQALSMYVDRPMEQVDPIERAVLRLAAFELRDRLDVPYRVIINEAIEIAKRFGSDHGHTYVNGVLDQAAGQWRSAEINNRR